MYEKCTGNVLHSLELIYGFYSHYIDKKYEVTVNKMAPIWSAVPTNYACADNWLSVKM